MSSRWRILLLFVAVLGYGQVSWEREVIDSVVGASYFGTFNALAVESGGKSGVIYCDDDIQSIHYAVRDSGVWLIELVDAGFFGAFGYSLVYDDRSKPHVSYYRVDTQTAENTVLCYALRDSLGWHIAVIDTVRYRFPNWGGTKTSIAIDSTHRPCIAYMAYDTTTRQYVKYARYNGVSWDTAAVELNLLTDWAASLELDGDGNPHIAFIQSRNFIDTLKLYMQDSLGNWVMRAARSLDGGTAVSLDLAFDTSQHPHIAYDEGAALAYSWWDGSWHTDYLAGIGWVGVRISLVLDRQDHPHVIYLPDAPNRPYYCFKDSVWHAPSPLEPDTYTVTDQDNDIQLRIDRNDRLHAIYPCYRYAAYDGAIKHAWRDVVGIADGAGLSAPGTEPRLSVLPTVSKGLVNLDYMLSGSCDVELTIYDASGAKVKSVRYVDCHAGRNHQPLDLRGRASGIYFVVLTCNGNQATRKVIIVR